MILPAATVSCHKSWANPNSVISGYPFFDASALRSMVYRGLKLAMQEMKNIKVRIKESCKTTAENHVKLNCIEWNIKNFIITLQYTIVNSYNVCMYVDVFGLVWHFLFSGPCKLVWLTRHEAKAKPSQLKVSYNVISNNIAHSLFLIIKWFISIFTNLKCSFTNLLTSPCVSRSASAKKGNLCLGAMNVNVTFVCGGIAGVCLKCVTEMYILSHYWDYHRHTFSPNKSW